jgi:hypothetical protein
VHDRLAVRQRVLQNTGTAWLLSGGSRSQSLHRQDTIRHLIPRHTTGKLRTPLPISLNRGPIVSFHHFPLPNLHLSPFGEKSPRIRTRHRQTTNIINLHTDTALGETSSPTNRRRRQIKLEMAQRDWLTRRDLQMVTHLFLFSKINSLRFHNGRFRRNFTRCGSFTTFQPSG